MSPATVLLIEDDEVFRRTLLRFFLRHGWRVLETGSYDAAVPLASAHQPASILLDLNLGATFALDLIAPLAAAVPGVRIVVLSGCGNLPVAVQAIKRGAADYLLKPVEGQTILAALQAEHPLASPLPSSPCMPLEELEKAHITQVLAEHNGNISQTADVLKMHRRTLQRKLSKYQPASRGHEGQAAAARRRTK